MPDPSSFPKLKAPPVDMSKGGPAVVRPQTRVAAQSTVEMMMGSGLKYVHASGKARGKGMEGDLEKSRKQVSLYVCVCQCVLFVCVCQCVLDGFTNITILVKAVLVVVCTVT